MSAIFTLNLITIQAIPSTVVTDGTAASFTPVTAFGGTGILSFALSGGTLPTGLSFSTLTGLISGTPSTVLTLTTFTVTVTDQTTPTPKSSSKTFDLTANAASGSALWNQIVADNGLLSTRPIDPVTGYRHPLNGIYPFGLPQGFSWYYGGPNYLGDLSQQCPAGWTAYTVWYVVYCEAVSAGGAAKPSVPCNVITRNCKAWAHTNSNTWVQIQGLPGQLMLSGRSDGAQTGNQGFALNPVANPDGTFTEQAPPNDIGSGTGWANHGFPNSRGLFTANSIDGVYGTFEMRVDQPNANKLCASGSDWWLDANAAYPNNTGYSQSAWIRLDTNFRLFSATNLSTTTLQSNPPPPLVGLI